MAKTTAMQRLKGKAVPGNEANVPGGYCQSLSAGETGREPGSKQPCGTAEGLWLPQKQSEGQLGVLAEERNNLLTCENNILAAVMRIVFKERKVQAQRPIQIIQAGIEMEAWNLKKRLSKEKMGQTAPMLRMCLRQRPLWVRGAEAEAEMSRGLSWPGFHSHFLPDYSSLVASNFSYSCQCNIIQTRNHCGVKDGSCKDPSIWNWKINNCVVLHSHLKV